MIEYIILHCSDSPQGRGDNAETIHNWHLEKGWSGIGYNFVILEDGSTEVGRPPYWQGAHTKGYNHNSIGICMIGKDSFTPEQINGVLNLINGLMVQYNIPKERVLGHCETALAEGKACPNYPMQDIRARL